MQVSNLQDMNMSNQITVTLGRNDRKLTEFLLEREGLSNTDELTGINIRNQLYELLRMIKQEEA